MTKELRNMTAVLTVVLLSAGGLVALLKPSTSAGLTGVTVYKSPTCGCCSKWVAHLQDNGFVVDVRDRGQADMRTIKEKFSVSPPLRSCHTAVVDGYVIEGHVPAEDIHRMLKEKPVIHGLAVPGMPMGSPGMEGPHRDKYAVLAFAGDGHNRVFSRH